MYIVSMQSHMEQQSHYPVTTRFLATSGFGQKEKLGGSGRGREKEEERGRRRETLVSLIGK